MKSLTQKNYMISAILKKLTDKFFYVQPNHLKKMSEQSTAHTQYQLVKFEGQQEVEKIESDIRCTPKSFCSGIERLSQNNSLKIYTYIERDVCLHNEIAVTHDGRIVTELLAAKGNGLFAKFPISWVTYIRARLCQLLPSISSQSFDYAVLLTTPFGKNYYHCIVDVVLRLPSYIYITNSFVPSPVFVVTSPLTSLPSFYQEFLSILGIEIHEQEYVKAKKLIVASPARVGFAYSRNAIAKLQQLLYARLNIEQTYKKERIYITRRDARSRRVINEDEVINLMDKWNFKIYELEQLTVEEQVRLFANADIVVGPHGAGLTNIIFSSRPTLLELLPEDDFVSWGHFASLCLSMGGIYRCVLGRVLDYSAIDIWPILDFTVPLSVLESELLQLIEYSKSNWTSI